jgi:hypothetical protein
MPCVLTLLSSQNFTFGINSSNCPPVMIPICLPPNTLLYTIDSNGCESYLCVNLENQINPFIPSGFGPNSGNGTLFFPDSGVFVSPFCSNTPFADLTPFIPTGFASSGRAGTLFFPDSGAPLSIFCTNIQYSNLVPFIPTGFNSSGRAGTLFFPDSGAPLSITCSNIQFNSNFTEFISVIPINNSNGGTLFFPDSGIALCVN